MIYDELLDRLTDYFTGPEFHDEVTKAKEDFFGQMGAGLDAANSEDAQNFEVKMSQFLDWYLFTRNLESRGVPPVRWALESVDFKIDESEREAYANIAEARHSVFEFLKLSGKNVYLRDLFTGKKIILKDSHLTDGFNRDEYFETRVIPSEDSYVFSRGFCFHPAEARKFILKEIKRVKKQGHSVHEELMSKFMKMRYKYDQYRHVALKHIYTNESKMKF